MSDNTTLTDVIMPQLAESLVSATIGKWLKQPGDPIEQYEPICELITDKVNAELPATVDGTMAELLAEEGQTVSVGEIIARIAVAGSAAPAAAAPSPAASGDAPAPAAAPAAAGGTAPQAAHAAARPPMPAAAYDAAAPMRARYSPAVQTLAAEHGINLAAVPGTGLGGRITRKDVLTFLENGVSVQPPAPAAAPAAAPVPDAPCTRCAAACVPAGSG